MDNYDKGAIVHGRDVMKILETLYTDIQTAQSSKTADVNKTIEKILNDADRDLQLKTQAVVRNKLSRARTIPSSTIPHPVIPEVKECDYFPETRPRRIAPMNVPISGFKPLRPLSSIERHPEYHPPRPATTTEVKPIPSFDRHDPLAPLEPVPSETIDQYGVYDLLESRVLETQVATDLLVPTITVQPFTFDYAELESIKTQHYVLAEPEEDFEEVQSTTEKEDNSPQQNYQIKGKDFDAVRNIFTFKYGEPDRKNDNFLDFRRHNSTLWEHIDVLLRRIHDICERYGLKSQRINGNALLELARYDPDEVTFEKLQSCFCDSPNLISMKEKKAGFGFIGPHANDMAATVIQSVWRGFHARRLLRNIRRNHAAARIIQRNYRSFINKQTFMKQIIESVNRKILGYNALQNEGEHLVQLDKAILVTLENVTCNMFGLLSLVEHSILIIYTRKMIDPALSQKLQEYNPEIIFLYSQLRIPETTPIDNLLACDSKSLNRIKGAAQNVPLVYIPSTECDAVVDVSYRLNALVMMPPIQRKFMYRSRDAMQRFFHSAGFDIFESSEVVYERGALVTALTSLVTNFLYVNQWIVRVNNGMIGWINIDDIVLLEKLRVHKGQLKKEDVNDPQFLEILRKQIATDLDVIMNTLPHINASVFLKDVWSNGATIEAAALQPRCAPFVSCVIPLTGDPIILGNGELLFSSIYEPFASIHPAFMVGKDVLDEASERFVKKCDEKRLIGYNTAEFTYSPRVVLDAVDTGEVQMQLTATCLHICDINRALPVMLSNLVLNNLDSKKLPTFVKQNYVFIHPSLQFPVQVTVDEIVGRLRALDIPMDSRVNFYHSPKSSSELGVIVTEETPERLIILLYKIYFALSEQVFNLSKYPTSNLQRYTNAIQYLFRQLDPPSTSLKSTMMMTKIKAQELPKEEPQRVFNLAGVQSEESEQTKSPKTDPPPKSPKSSDEQPKK